MVTSTACLMAEQWPAPFIDLGPVVALLFNWLDMGVLQLKACHFLRNGARKQLISNTRLLYLMLRFLSEATFIYVPV